MFGLTEVCCGCLGGVSCGQSQNSLNVLAKESAGFDVVWVVGESEQLKPR